MLRAPEPPTADAERVAALRAFNRFYTRRLGVLREHLLATRFSLPESRVLWELAHTPGITASDLTRALDLDAGYLSRLLAGLRERGLVKAQRSAADGRRTLLALSAAGRRAFAPLDRRSHEQMAGLLAPLAEPAQQDLVAAARRMQALLGDAAPGPVGLRALRPGDIGWVVARHGAIYAAEYGWDLRFEALVARIAADYVDRLDAAREAAWIAERDGQPLGCVFLVQARDETGGTVEPGVAQLRLLLVEPSARGGGIGHRLVDACTAFARDAGYTRIRLWTNSVLVAARAIYAGAGYRLVATEPHTSFGHELVGEVWELAL
jgi:DNA-binding MarR family transcriptional regulator/GNAT superfamily N-acetyltransferase